MTLCSGTFGYLPVAQFVSLLQVYILWIVPQRRELNIPQATGINRCETSAGQGNTQKTTIVSD